MYYEMHAEAVCNVLMQDLAGDGGDWEIMGNDSSVLCPMPNRKLNATICHKMSNTKDQSADGKSQKSSQLVTWVVFGESVLKYV